MTPDINLKGYYLRFIRNAAEDAHKYRLLREETKTIKEEVYNYINEHKQNLISSFKINIEDYDIEWNKKQYSDSEALYNKSITTLNNNINHSDRIIILQVVKYCNILRNENRYIKLTDFCYKRKNITFGEYRKIVAKYYNKVHKCVLEGMGYRFSYNIGTYVINRWVIPDNYLGTNYKKIIDYQATKEKKKELIAAGIKVYNDLEATWYKARNIPYDGVDYRVWNNKNYFYEFTFINSGLLRRSNVDYERTEYVYAKYRGIGYKKLAETKCNNINDIYDLQVDIKYKLNMLLHLYPNKYINFIRNDKQNKYQYRENYI